MQLGFARNSSRIGFLYDLFLKFPTFSIRKAQARLSESQHGPQMMRTRTIAVIRGQARAHLDKLAARTPDEVAIDEASAKLCLDIEKDLYRDYPYPETARRLGGIINVSLEEIARIKQQFDSSAGNWITPVVKGK